MLPIDGQSIHRSTDGGATWSEVHRYEVPEDWHVQGGQGLRDLDFGLITAGE